MDNPPDETTDITATEELLAGIEVKMDTVILWLQIIAGILFGIGAISLIG